MVEEKAAPKPTPGSPKKTNDQKNPRIGTIISFDASEIYPKVPAHHDHEETVPKKSSKSRLRSVGAVIFSLTAVGLITACVVLAWAKHTITDTPTYTATITALAKQSDIQKFAGEKIGQAIIDNSPPRDLAMQMGIKIPAGATPNQIKNIVRPRLDASIEKTIGSQQFIDFWQKTNQSIHGQLISALDGDAQIFKIDLRDTIKRLVNLLETNPELGFIKADNLSTPDASIGLKVNQLDAIRRIFRPIDRYGLPAVILATSLAVGLAIAVSNRRLHTLRLIAILTFLSMAVLILVIELPARLHPSVSDPDAWAAAVSIIKSLLGGLQKLSMFVGAASLLILGLSILVPRLLERRGRPSRVGTLAKI